MLPTSARPVCTLMWFASGGRPRRCHPVRAAPTQEGADHAPGVNRASGCARTRFGVVRFCSFSVLKRHASAATHASRACCGRGVIVFQSAITVSPMYLSTMPLLFTTAFVTVSRYSLQTRPRSGRSTKARGERCSPERGLAPRPPPHLNSSTTSSTTRWSASDVKLIKLENRICREAAVDAPPSAASAHRATDGARRHAASAGARTEMSISLAPGVASSRSRIRSSTTSRGTYLANDLRLPCIASAAVARPSTPGVAIAKRHAGERQ